MSWYVSVKYLHVIAVALSITLFVIRAWWSVTGCALLQTRLVRVAPHVIDTVLLVCGLILAFTIGFNQPWIWTKIVLLLVYIGVGTIAIKRGRTAAGKALAAVLAVAVFAYIVGVAINHDPASWFVMR